MKNYLAFYSLFLYSASVMAWGAPYPSPAWDSMTDTTATINQLTQQTDSPGRQEKQWDQEEERMEMTDDEKEEVRKIKEEQQDTNGIESYRYDVVPRRKELD